MFMHTTSTLENLSLIVFKSHFSILLVTFEAVAFLQLQATC